MAAEAPAAGIQAPDIGEAQAALRQAISTKTGACSAATTADESHTYAETVLALCQALAAIDPSLHPKKESQGPGSRPGASKEKP